MRRGDRLEHDRGLAVVEAIREVVRTCVRETQRAEAPVILDVMQDAGELVLLPRAASVAAGEREREQCENERVRDKPHAPSILVRRLGDVKYA